jgi:hypothetical protein
MRPSKIFNVLDLTRRINKSGKIFNPLFVGAPGIGKSEIVQAWCRHNNLPFMDLRLAYLEAPDMIGFPYLTDADNGKKMSHALPDFWPTSGEGVIFLDEPNRGTTAIMNTVMQLLTDRRVHKYVLPPEWIVVSAINPESVEYDVTTMDPALRNRYEIFTVEYDKKSFIDYMHKNNWHPVVSSYVESGVWQYKLPEQVASDTPGNKYTSPRSISKLNAVCLAGVDSEDEMEVYESILGKNEAKKFFQFKNDEAPVFLEDILNNQKAALKKLKKYSDPNDYKNGHIAITISDMVNNEHLVDDVTLAEVCKVLPADQVPQLLKRLEFKRKDDKITQRILDANKSLWDSLKNTLNTKKD